MCQRTADLRYGWKDPLEKKKGKKTHFSCPSFKGTSKEDGNRPKSVDTKSWPLQFFINRSQWQWFSLSGHLFVKSVLVLTASKAREEPGARARFSNNGWKSSLTELDRVNKFKMSFELAPVRNCRIKDRRKPLFCYSVSVISFLLGHFEVRRETGAGRLWDCPTQSSAQSPNNQRRTQHLWVFNLLNLVHFTL